jgi:Na+/melibiose symporter-like transporter
VGVLVAAGSSLFFGLLGYIGFKANVPQPLHVQTGVRYTMSFYPAVVGFLSAVAALLYRLYDTTMVQMERDLKQRRPLPSSADNLSPSTREAK